MAEIYERSAPAGFRLAYLLTGDRALAEDLVQEAFLRFVGRLQHLSEPEAFDSYLRRTIVNLSKDVFRRRALERSNIARRTAELREGHTDRDVAAYESMRAALLSLPPRQRAAIVLRTTKTSTSPRSPSCSAAGRRRCARSSRAGSRPSAPSPR